MRHEYKGNILERSPSGAPGPAATRTDSATRVRTGRSPAQVLAAVFGLVFLLVGIAGFIPGITSNSGDLAAAGTSSHAELLGLFRVSVLHNVVHMLFGVGLLAAARPAWARAYLLGGGVAYLVVAAYGLVVEESSSANFLPVNAADTVLHVALALALLVTGVATARVRDTGS